MYYIQNLHSAQGCKEEEVVNKNFKKFVLRKIARVLAEQAKSALLLTASVLLHLAVATVRKGGQLVIDMTAKWWEKENEKKKKNGRSK